MWQDSGFVVQDEQLWSQDCVSALGAISDVHEKGPGVNLWSCVVCGGVVVGEVVCVCY